MIVDYQSHWYPVAAIDALVGRTDGYPRAQRVDGKYLVEADAGRPMSFAGFLEPSFIDLDEQFRFADDAGIDMLVSSPAGLNGVWDMGANEAVEFCELLNEELGRAQRARPERFRGLATIPLHHPDRAIGVLECAARTHDLRGVCVPTSVHAATIATPELLPVFKAVERLELPLFLHPTLRTYTSDLKLGNMIEGGLGWMFHSSVTALGLIENGILDDCPDLVVVHPHLGGTLPYVLGRLDRIGAAGREAPVSEYLRTRFYTDSVGPTGPALQLAIDAYGVDRVLFGTDFPYLDMARLVAYVEENASAGDASAILYRNTVGRILDPVG